MSSGGAPGAEGRRRLRTVGIAVAGWTVLTVAALGLGIQAARGNAVVSAQAATATDRAAHIDDAFYRCLDVQTRSLVRPGQTVALVAANLGDLVTMLKAVGSWVTVADPPASAHVSLTLHNGPPAPGTCLGTFVVGISHEPGGRLVTRVGTGAQVPGRGPPPAPPL